VYGYFAQINVTYENPGVACGGGGTTQTVNYTEDTVNNIPNPERGFQPSKTSPLLTQPLGPSDVTAMNANAQTVVHRIYNIGAYKGTSTTYVPIAQTYLNAITSEMTWARNNGFKMDIRFAYWFNDSCSPQTNPFDPATDCRKDAPVSTIQNHIDQLTPVLQANSDVIAFMSAGFAGLYGEWHESTNGLIGVGSDVLALNANGRAIIDKLLAVTNFGRSIVLRYPRNKREYIDNSATTFTALQQAQAYGTTARARLGHMNDCFTGSTTEVVSPPNPNPGTYVYEDNGGTYYPSLVSNTAGVPNKTVELNQQKDYLNQENQFLPQVGEVCGTNVSGYYTPQFSDCTPARAELIRMRWSHLTDISNVTAFNDGWSSGGCLEEFKKRLGYRFVLTSATFPTTQSGAAGQTLSVSLNIRNDGFARPYNPRGLELVLQKQGTTTYTRLPVSTTQDVRLVLPGPGTSNTNLLLSR
jgi:hypothetical protein